MLRERIWDMIDKYGIWNAITALGLDCFLLKIRNRKEIAVDRKYFRNNRNKIRSIFYMLEDETSRQHYKNAWKFRLSYMKKYRPLPMGSKYLTNQYFDKEIIDISNREVFVDGGAFDGDTYEQFCKVTNGQFKGYVAFEPDRNNYKSFINKVKNDDRIIVRNKGLWDSPKTMYFHGGNLQKSALSERGGVENIGIKINDHENKIEVQDLDTDLDCQDATFIKMDIEGSELKALKGAEQLITKNHPKLAICIYHSCEDMVDIISYLHRLVPEYKIYVRHHSLLAGETVMYAVI